MTKAELMRRIAQDAALTRRQAEQAVKVFADSIHSVFHLNPTRYPA
jgi:nucleoid DNA-binding protein